MSEGLLRHVPRLLVLLSLLCLLALGVVLVAQHVFNVKPCPWCVLQRVVVLLLALAAGVGGALAWVVKRQGSPAASRLASRLAAVPVLVLALAGLVAATYQHEVASQKESCAMGFADRVLVATELETRWPALFMVTANCQEAATYRLLGQPYEIWSGLFFAVALAVALVGLLRRPPA